MSKFIPTNDLDRALIAFQRSRSAMPDLYRALGEGELWFLVPWHPEVEEGVMELREGMPLPFVQIAVEGEPVVPLFSSLDRAGEGLEQGKVPPRMYCPAAMDAKQLLQVLGGTKLRAVINKGCATGEVTIPPELMRDLASGKALEPQETMGEHDGSLRILDPADYPTDLVQPAFEILRKHRAFRAAWIFGASGEPLSPEGKPRYQMLTLMDPIDEAVMHELNIVVFNACERHLEVELGRLDADNAELIAGLFADAPPFFVAEDYGRGPAAEG